MNRRSEPDSSSYEDRDPAPPEQPAGDSEDEETNVISDPQSAQTAGVAADGPPAMNGQDAIIVPEHLSSPPQTITLDGNPRPAGVDGGPLVITSGHHTVTVVSGSPL